MEKIKTESYFVDICKSKDKVFIRRKKRRGLHAYPRTLSLKDINKCLEKSNVKYPRLLRNRFRFVDEDFIESTKDINDLSNVDILEKVIDIIYELSKIEIKNKKITWCSNSEFFRFNIDNMKKVLINKKIDNIDKYLLELDSLYKELDESRKLMFIHGDIHKKNMIINNDDFYLIDWELATYGDLAYELATHFILMNYNEEEKEMFLDKLNKKIDLDVINLKKDINIYISFEIYRRKILEKISKNTL